jgi:Family of unknown function (DUF6130)
MFDQINQKCRRFLATATAMTIAAVKFRTIDLATAEFIQKTKTIQKEDTMTNSATQLRFTARAAVLLLVVTVAAGTLFGTIISAQSAKDVRGATPYVPIKNEPAPKLIVDQPLPEGLAIGVVWIQYRVENLRILPVFGKDALNVSPRIGHLHITVDDLSWWWADASDSNTIDIAGLPVGQHKVRIELVNANHQIIPGQTKTVTFTLPMALPHE